jgi:hypothetical protein
MTFIRSILIFVFVYLLIRLLGRWLVSALGGTKVEESRKKRARKDYSTLTDQKIEDADFEEIKNEDKQ